MPQGSGRRKSFSFCFSCVCNLLCCGRNKPGHVKWEGGVLREYQQGGLVVAMLQFYLHRPSKKTCVQTGFSKEKEQNNTRA